MSKKYNFISYVRNWKEFTVNLTENINLSLNLKKDINFDIIIDTTGFSQQIIGTGLSTLRINPIVLQPFLEYKLTEYMLDTYDPYVLNYMSGSLLRTMDGYV